MKAKVLTVKQPWAHLIIHGYGNGLFTWYKGVENRTWYTHYRGRLYIHAGQTWDSLAMLGLHELGQLSAAADVTRHFMLDYGDVTRRHAGDFGAIIGHVDLVEVIKNSPSEWAEAGLVHWVLINPVAIDPIPVRGQLGIWEYDLQEGQ